MRDLRELADWFATRPNPHDPLTPSSLPEPAFVSEGRRIVSFSTNNYLALATSARLKAAARRALECYGVGNCESRLLGGNLDLYDRLEEKLARLKNKETSMVFATGYLTNLGVLPMLVRSTHLARAIGYRPTEAWKHAFFTDEFNHLSLREGIRASGAPSIAYKHLDMGDLERKLELSPANVRIIVTDGVFSQHGDIVPLPDMMALAERYDAVVYIDDAHGTGVLGPTGSGTTEHFGIESPRIITMGTLSKAYGCIGGFVATESYLRTLLHAGCSAYGFTSTLPPDQAAAVIEAIDMVADEPERLRSLWDNQRYFVAAMLGAGFQLPATATAIVPLVLGDEVECVRVSRELREAGFHVDPVLYPAVGFGQARLRFIMNAHHTRADIDGLVGALCRAVRRTLRTERA
jgi:8-amino-7-oxononanoate synthase